MAYGTAAGGARADTAIHHLVIFDGARETRMANARIDRMMSELQSEPSTQFFQALFGLTRPGRQTARVDAVALDCVVGAFVAERTQRRDDHRVAVHLEKAA